jgi:hypothetical protein
MKKTLIALALSTAFHSASAEFMQKPPGGLEASKVPMFVCFGFDDNGRIQGAEWFANLGRTHKNPAGGGNPATYDGTNVKATWFLTASYATDTGFVQQGSGTLADLINAWKALAKDGHEIGNHTWTHPHGTGLDLAGWKDEIQKTNDFIVSTLGVERSRIKGFRTPFLEYTPTTLEALKDLGFAYDCSIEFGFNGWQPLAGDSGYWNSMTDPNTHKKLFWPWALDEGSPPGNASKGNPKIPGMQEVPVYTYMKEAGGEVTGIDFNLWMVMDRATFVKTLKKEFDLRRAGNRNPLVINLHSDYYAQYNDDANQAFTLASWQDRQKAIEEFLDYVLSFPETRVVPFGQMLDWMAKPVALDGASGSVKSPKLLNQSALTLKLSARGGVEIDVPSPGHYDFALMDARGGVVMKRAGNFSAGTARLQTGRKLAPGIYFLKVGNGVETVMRKAALTP